MSNKIFTFILFLICISFTVSIQEYFLTSREYVDEKQSHIKGILEYTSVNFNASQYEGIDWLNTSESSISVIRKLNIDIKLELDKVIHVKISDADNQRWEVPYTISDEYKKEAEEYKATKSLKDFGFEFMDDPTSQFCMNLYSPSGLNYFSTENPHFLFTDRFITFGAQLTSDDIFGFGERYHALKLGPGKFTIWPNDTKGIKEDDGKNGYYSYGTHPMGIHRTKEGKFIGIIFNNINAQDVIITKNDEGATLEHRTVGGIIDYYIYPGESLDDTLIFLHKIIGHPTLPPFWTLGFHLCRWGYQNEAEIRTLFNKFSQNALPIDTFWGDIDIFQDYRIFTLNKENFSELPKLINDLHNKNYHFIPIVDLGFPKNESDEYYVRGKGKAFIVSNYTKDDLVSYVWPGEAVFPDFFSKEGVDLWNYGLEKYYSIVKYDALWHDMNEPAMTKNLKNSRGEILDSEADYDPKFNSYDFIPYKPGYTSERPNLEAESLSVNAMSREIGTNPFLVSYNFKPLISYVEGSTSYDYLNNNLNKRPFILSRSTVLGSGKKVFHWLGDNQSSYKDMRNGLDGIFQFQIYGIPMTGDDICGFNKESNDILCSKWMSVGAFFPFMRNHNRKGTQAQDPFAYGMDSKTYKMSKIAIKLRYSLLRYFYSELFMISLGKSGSFFKPLFFEYPNDVESYNYTNSAALIGNALYLIPCLTEEDKMIGYFPNSDFMEFNSRKIFKTYNESEEKGTTEEFIFDYQSIKLFMRGGYIVPYQDISNSIIYNTHSLHEIKTDLIIQPDSFTHIATGRMVFDNDQKEVIKNKEYLLINLSFNYNKLIFDIENNYSYAKKDILIGRLRFCRINYLVKENKWNFYVQVTDKFDNTYNTNPIKVDEDNFDVDFKELKLSYTVIKSVTIIPLKKMKFIEQ
ncbi:MAG: hypothetical protein MJ252_13795 [archaeon]|nr:hypothetical protein [archaeon]